MMPEDVDAILDQVRSRGGRVTPVTRRIVQIAIANPYEHLCSADFVDAASDVEPVTESTVYRTLDRLVEHEVLTRSQLGSGPPRFHLSTLHHEHLVCEVCGRIIDVSPGFLDEVTQRIRSEYDFVLKIGRSSLNGTCGTCRNADDEVGARHRV